MVVVISALVGAITSVAPLDGDGSESRGFWWLPEFLPGSACKGSLSSGARASIESGRERRRKLLWPAWWCATPITAARLPSMSVRCPPKTMATACPARINQSASRSRRLRKPAVRPDDRARRYLDAIESGAGAAERRYQQNAGVSLDQRRRSGGRAVHRCSSARHRWVPPVCSTAAGTS